MLLKYGGLALAKHIAGVLNAIFVRGEVNGMIHNIWSRLWRYVQTEWNLQVNRDKTECTRIYLAPKGSPDHGNEACRQMTLGSHLDCAVDV